jgi:hypothetical protein
VQLTTIHDAEVTVPASGISVIVLTTGIGEPAFYLISVRNLTFAPDASPIYWQEAAIPVNPQGAGGREVVLRNNANWQTRVHVKVLQVAPEKA